MAENSTSAKKSSATKTKTTTKTSDDKKVATSTTKPATKSAAQKPAEKPANKPASTAKTTSQTTSSSTKSTSSSSSSNSNNILAKWGLNKISFYTICAVAVLYLIATIFSIIGLSAALVGLLQGFATAIMICIVAYLGWKYVKNKPSVWQILYGVCLLVVIIGIVLPLILG